MPRKITAPEPEIYENNDYKIEYRHHAENLQDFRVTDKQTGEKQALVISTTDERYNIDGSVNLTLIKGEKGQEIDVKDVNNNNVTRLSAVRPRGELMSSEPKIGSRDEKDEEGLYHSVMDLESFMSIHRALKNGDFKSADGKSDKSEEVLQFMDKYLFNTEEHRQVLAEYMVQNPLTKQPETAEPEKKKTNNNVLSAALKRFRNGSQNS